MRTHGHTRAHTAPVGTRLLHTLKTRTRTPYTVDCEKGRHALQWQKCQVNTATGGRSGAWNPVDAGALSAVPSPLKAAVEQGAQERGEQQGVPTRGGGALSAACSSGNRLI